MTIKPVSAPSGKRVVDADATEAHVSGQVVVVEQSVVNQSHRNVVIDGHGQVCFVFILILTHII